MKTMWMVKHKASDQFMTKPKASPEGAWVEFWDWAERIGQMNKVDQDEYVAVAVTITETGDTCSNKDW